MARITRKELKKDVFAQEVGHTVEYVGEHRKQFIRYGSAALVIVLLAGGFYYYNKRQRAAREGALAAAMEIQRAPVGPAAGQETVKSYPTQQEKSKAELKAFTEVAAHYAGTDEGIIATYFLGTIAVDDGRLDEAAKLFKEVGDSKNENYASLAKFSLAHVYQSQGKAAEGEKLLRALMEKPTIFVSKPQATIALARMLAPTKPDEARKLLEPLRLEAGPAARAAFSILNALPKKG